MSIDPFDVTVPKSDPWRIVRGTPDTSDEPTSFFQITRGEPNRLGFPERISLDANIIQGALTNLQYAPDTLLGATKFLPIVRGVGDVLGGVGRATLDQLPEPVLGAGKFASDALTETVTGIGRRIGAVAGEVGRTFDTSDPAMIPFNILNAPLRIGATGALGETGAKAITGRGRLNWDEATKDVLDTFAVASVIPAMKVAGLIGKSATGGNTAAQVARGFATPFEKSLAPTAAENYARLAGRVVSGAYGGGFALRNTLPHVAGNEWWAKEILENRIVPDDNAWRFPMDLAMSLPLDLVQLTRLTASSRQSAWAARKVLGEAPPPLLLRLPDAERSIGTTISNENWGWTNRKLIEDAAANRLIDSLNTSLPEASRVRHGQWQKAAEMRGESPTEFRISIGEEIDRMFSSLGTRGAHELAARELDRWASTPGLTPGGLLQLADEYADWARRVEPANPGKVLAVDEFLHARQAPLAVNHLESLSEWGPAQHAEFKRFYPALADGLKDSFLTNKTDWINQVKTFIDGEAATVKRLPEEGYFYHGSGTEGLDVNTLDLDRGDIQSLFGPGLYITNREQTAVDYALKRGKRTTTPTLYRVELTGARTLDMDRPLPQDALDAIRSSVGEFSEDLATLGADATGGHVWKTLREAVSADSVQNGIPVYEYAEMFHVIRERLAKLGYDAMSYRGGLRTGSPEHDAMVILNKDIVRNISTKTESGVVPPAKTTPPAKMGSLLAQLYDLDTRIYRGEKVGELRSKVASEIASLRGEVADGYKKQIETLNAARDARVAELSGDLSDLERQAVLDDIARMNDALSKANEDYYNLGVMAGARWRLETPPSGPVMRVSDDPIYKGDLSGRRTNMGKVYDALFGAVRNADEGRDATQKMMDAGASAGVSGSEMEEFMDALRQRVEEGTFTIGGAATFRLFASLWHLPPWIVDNVARSFKRANGTVGLPAPKGYSSWGEAVYRSYPGPFNIFARAIGKELPEMKYSPALHSVTRALYGTFRFTLDPRFILLNFGEPHIIRQALARTGEVDEQTVSRLSRMIEKIQEEVRDTGALDLSGRSRSIALYAWSRRPDEFSRSFLPLIKRQDEMKKVLASYGVKSDAEFVQFLDDTIRERVRLLEETEVVTKAEKALRDELDAAKKRVPSGDGERSLKSAEVERLEEELALSKRKREVLEIAKKEGWRPELQSALDVLLQVDQNVTRDAIRAFRGNPDRSAAERLLNSYLLYWPISYQIKAGKLLFEFMFSKGLGLRTGSAGAQAWLKVRKDHERKLQEDPEYAAFFDQNDDLLFLLQMLIPLTPNDIGVSLSPFTRIPMKIGRGEAPAKIVERTTNQGPVYTFGDLLPKLMAEQSKPGGMLYDMLKFTEGE